LGGRMRPLNTGGTWIKYILAWVHRYPLKRLVCLPRRCFESVKDDLKRLKPLNDGRAVRKAVRFIKKAVAVLPATSFFEIEPESEKFIRRVGTLSGRQLYLGVEGPGSGPWQRLDEYWQDYGNEKP